MADSLVKRVSLDMLHCNIIHTFFGVDVVNMDNIGMVKCRSGLSLLNKTLFALRISHFFWWKNFQCDKAVEMQVASFIDYSHASRANFLYYLIMTKHTTDHESIPLISR